MPATAPHVVVVGAGLAGLTAALDLAAAGRRVTLCESRPFCGGKIYSVDGGPRAWPGTVVDNGQHVFLRCCTRFLALLARLDAMGDVTLQPRLRIEVRAPDGRGAWRLAAQPLPAPLHMARSILGYGALPWRERWRLGRAARALRRVTPAARAGLDDVAFAEWLRDHGQSPLAIERFWDVFVLATLNLPSAQSSAALAIRVFQDGLLNDPHGGDVGWARVGLSDLVAARAVARLAAGGHAVRTGTRVTGVLAENRATGVRCADGTTIGAEAVVLAVPAPALPALLPAPYRTDPFFAAVPALGASPILNLHLGFDQPVMHTDFFALYGAPIHWVFNKGRLLGDAATDGRYLSLTTSGAARGTRRANDGLVEAACAALAPVLPALAGARLEWSRVVVEADATFAARPGTQRLRRGAVTPLAGCVLAGAWTDTGWPATMEGAVRSGEAAAAAVLAAGGAAEA